MSTTATNHRTSDSSFLPTFRQQTQLSLCVQILHRFCDSFNSDFMTLLYIAHEPSQDYMLFIHLLKYTPSHVAKLTTVILLLSRPPHVLTDSAFCFSFCPGYLRRKLVTFVAFSLHITLSQYRFLFCFHFILVPFNLPDVGIHTFSFFPLCKVHLIFSISVV